MDKIRSLIYFLFIVSVFVSCADLNERVLPRISGKAGDLLIVIDSVYWDNKTGAELQSIFSKEQGGLPQREAVFNLIKVSHRAFSQIFHTMRNIIMVKIDPEEKTKIEIREDVWAETQLIVTITAPNDKVAAEILQKNGETLLDYFNHQEIKRLQTKNQLNSDSKNAKMLKKEYKLKINIDDLYIVAKKKKDFIWFRKDKKVGEHEVSQGIMIYTYPYNSDSTFDVGFLVKKRNKVTKENVLSGIKNSYMQTYLEYIPKEKALNLKGIYVKELRGLWQMQGDFMGGPFISYTMVDEQMNRVITIDGYVYAPKFDKREFIRELEALALTINF